MIIALVTIVGLSLTLILKFLKSAILLAGLLIMLMLILLFTI